VDARLRVTLDRIIAVQIRPLSVPDAFEITPNVIRDDRGTFLEWYRFDKLEAVVGHALDLRQANTSTSKRGVVRGIHFADVPRGQAKYVTVTHGAAMDYVVDLRVGSPTFGKWDSVLLDDIDRRAVYLAEGLGHAFVSLAEDAVVTYLVSDVYNPAAEHGITPLDPEIGLVFPGGAGELVMSPKDSEAPTLATSLAAGILPDMAIAHSHYRSLADEAAR
jgi:dTDP-4-dehydrorhamnose 3,5-epimerase